MSESDSALLRRRAQRWRAGSWLVFAALCLTAFYTWSYGDCLGRFFCFDDFWQLKEASAIHLNSPLDVTQFFRPVPSFLLYRPVSTLLYFYLLHALFGYDPAAYHAVQMAFNILNALLVYAIANRLMRSHPLALGAALVYALAPGHMIAVYWIAAFNMTGAAFFYFLGLWAWLRLEGRWRVPLTLLLFLVALLASEHAVTFPLVLTLATALLEPQWNWRRALRQQAPFYAIAGAYVAAKIYYLRFIFASRYPLAAAEYALSFGPRMVLRHLGVYLRFGVGAFYTLIESDARAALAAGFLIAATASIATACVVTGRWRSTPLRLATFGIDIFIVALLPVVFLSAHVESYYVGIAAMGTALALLGLTQALPRLPKLAAGVLVGGLLCIHVFSTAALLRQTRDFWLFSGMAQGAADWLSTLATLDSSAVDEVVVPREPITQIVFDRGEAHKVLLCARYRVRTSPNIDREVPGPRRLILRRPSPASGAARSWDWVRRRCPG